MPSPDRRHRGGRWRSPRAGHGSVLAVSVKLGTLDEDGDEKGL